MTPILEKSKSTHFLKYIYYIFIYNIINYSYSSIKIYIAALALSSHFCFVHVHEVPASALFGLTRAENWLLAGQNGSSQIFKNTIILKSFVILLNQSINLLEYYFLYFLQYVTILANCFGPARKNFEVNSMGKRNWPFLFI